MKKNYVRIGAASMYVTKKDKQERNCFSKIMEFCEKYLPGCGCDIVLLPEPYESLTEDFQPDDGPIAKKFASFAKKNKLYLIAPLFEKVGKKYKISQLVFSPQGKLIFKYHKVHALITEGPNEPMIRGDKFETFELPWFRAGIMVCFDNQFPESSRSLAVQGAQVIFFPSFGDLFKPHRDAARCLDNHIYLVGASAIDRAINIPANKFEQGMIMDPKGRVLVNTKSKPGLAIGDLPLVNGKLAPPEVSGDTIALPVNYLEWRNPKAYTKK